MQHMHLTYSAYESKMNDIPHPQALRDERKRGGKNYEEDFCARARDCDDVVLLYGDG